MLPFVCVHVRVREGVCVSPSVRFDRTSLRSSMHAFVCLHARVREGVCLSPSIRLSVRANIRSLGASLSMIKRFIPLRIH